MLLVAPPIGGSAGGSGVGGAGAAGSLASNLLRKPAIEDVTVSFSEANSDQAKTWMPWCMSGSTGSWFWSVVLPFPLSCLVLVVSHFP